MDEKKEEIKIELVKYEMMVPKEGKEVVDLLDALIEKLQAKEDLSKFSELMNKVYVALDGISFLSVEAKSKFKDELAGYMVHKLMGRLLK